MTHLLLMRPKINLLISDPNPPIGLGYIAGILRAHGHQVDILDCAIRKESYPAIVSQVKKINPEVIGITALSPYFLEMRSLSRHLQLLKIPIILGGIHASALPELSMRECGANIVVVGEGELTTLELMDKWQDNEARKKIKGIAYLEKNQFKLNLPREPILNLDELPFPAWNLINPLKYPSIPHGHMIKRPPVAPILTTRGCPYSCSYCSSTQFWGHKFRRRSAQNVGDEIEFLVQKFKIREIHIWDDNFTLQKKHVVEFCQEIFRRKLDLTFACPNGVRIDSLNRDILKLMRQTGFYALTFAIESGSQKILNNANKKLDLKKIPKIAKIAKELGYILPSFFIFGLPGATYKTERMTIQLAKSLPLDSVGFFLASPLPGSKLCDEWIEKNKLNTINYEWFHFYGKRDRLIFTEGSKKLILPRDAYREFILRPKQIMRMLKLIPFYPIKNIAVLFQLILNYFS